MPANFAVSISIKAIDQVTQTLNRVTNNISNQTKKSQSVWDQLGGGPTRPTGIAGAFSAFKDEVRGIAESPETKVFFKGLELGTGRAMAGFKQLGTAARESIRGITTAGFAIAGVGFLSHRMFADIAHSNTDLKNTSRSLGIKPKDLMAHRLAAESMGLPASAMDSALARINEAGFRFRAGDRGALAPFAAFDGVRFQDKNGLQRDPLTIFHEMSDSVSKSGASDIGIAQALSNALGSADLTPMMKLGRTGIHEKTSKLTDEEFEKSDAASSRYLAAHTAFTASLDKLKRSASIDILPGIAKGLDRISDWIDNHGQDLKKLFEDIGNSIPEEMSRAVVWMSRIATALEFLSAHVGLANIAVGSFAILVGGNIIGALMNFGKALKFFLTLGPVVNMLNSIKTGFLALRAAMVADGSLGILGTLGIAAGGALVAVAAVTALLYVYRKEIMDWAESAADWCKQAFSGVGEWIERKVKSLTELVSSVSAFFGKSSTIAVENNAASNDDWMQNRTEKTDFLRQLMQNMPKKEAPATSKQIAEVTVKFDNLPKGARISDQRGDVALNIHAGYMRLGTA